MLDQFNCINLHQEETILVIEITTGFHAQNHALSSKPIISKQEAKETFSRLNVCIAFLFRYSSYGSYKAPLIQREFELKQFTWSKLIFKRIAIVRQIAVHSTLNFD